MLVFLHLASRKVFVTRCTCQPNSTWMTEQTRQFAQQVQAVDQQPTLLLRDRDILYSQGFDQTLRAAGIKVKKNSVRAPNLQAHIERFNQSLQQ